MEPWVSESPTDYRVDLPLFEGPLDLLLHLIRKNDLDIRDIPIATILSQYLEYLNLARDLDIDLAGEFLETAAELTYIKSKLLLPEAEPEGEEGPDPRADLVARLLEYQKFKRAAEFLSQRPLLGRDVFRRRPVAEAASDEEEMIEVDTLALLNAFQEVLKRLPREQSHVIRNERVGVAERVIELIEGLRGKQEIRFEALFEADRTRTEIVVTLLALLEMARQKLVRIVQEGVNGAIAVCPLFSEET